MWMTLDTSDLQRAISKLEDDVAQLRRLANAAADGGASSNGDLSDVGLTLPPEIVVRDPNAVATYLSAHPNLTELVGEKAAALVEEFRGERSEIELVLYQDPEIDDRQLTFYVRVPDYDDSLMPRLDAVWEQVDGRYPPTHDWVLVTTDHRPIQ